MTARNWGLPRVTTGRASGAQPLSRSHYRADTQRDSNVIQLAGRLPPDRTRLNSLGFGRELFIENEQPVIEPYELGSGLLFLFVFLLPWVIVGGLVIGYLAFVS